MNETAQSLAEKIRRLELQGADLLTVGCGAAGQLPDRIRLQSRRGVAAEGDATAASAVHTSHEDVMRFGLRSYSDLPEDWKASPHRSPNLRVRYHPSLATASSDTRNAVDEHRADASVDSAPFRRLPRRTLSLSGAQLPRPEDMPSLAQSSPMLDWEEQQHQQQLKRSLHWQQQQQSIAAEQSNTLRMQLDEANHRCEQMRTQFRSTIEDLNKRLHEAIAEKDYLQESRQKNELAQDALIERLQSSLAELREAYQAQERTLAEADSRCEQLRAALAEQEQLASAVRQAAASAELRRSGRKCTSATAMVVTPVGGTTSGQQAAVLLQQWLEEADADVNTKDARIVALEHELEESRKVLHESQAALEKNTEEKISRLKESSSKLLQASEERSDNLREQLNSFRGRATFLEEQLDHHKKANAENVHELEKRIAALTEDLLDQKRLNDSKNTELTDVTAEARRAAAAAATQLEDACRHSSILQKKIDTYEVMLERLRAECELERSQTQRLWRREEELAQKRSDAESRLAERDAEVVRLRELVTAVKEECARQLSAEVKMVEARESQRSAEELGTLRRQLEISSDERERVALQLSTVRIELQVVQERETAAERDLSQLREQLRETAAARDEALADGRRLSGELRAAAERHEEAAAELRRAAGAEHDALSRRLDAAVQEAARLAAERDRYAAAAAEAATEAASREASACEAREIAERLGERLANAEADADRLRRERADALAEAEARGEREAAQAAAGELVRLQLAMEQAAARAVQLEVAERQLAEQVEAAKVKLADEKAIVIHMEGLLEQKDHRLQQVQKELEAKDVDLRNCKDNIASLAEERNILISALKGQEGQSQTDISRLLEKLRTLEQECRLTQEMLKAKDSLEAKAAYATDKLRKELLLKRKINEELLGKIRWLEERMDVSAKEKASLAEANEQLTETISRLEMQRSSDAVSSTAELIEQKCLKDKVHRLETEFDRMSMRCQQLQSALHLSEQRAAMTRLKQKLDSAATMQTVAGSANGAYSKRGLHLSPHTLNGLPNNSSTGPSTTLPVHGTTALKCSEDYLSHTDARAIVTEMRSLMSAVQRETAASAGFAVRDTLGAVLPALITGSSRSSREDACEGHLPSCKERSCYNSNTYLIRKSSQGHGVGQESLTSSDEGTSLHKQSYLRKKRAKVVSKSLQIEATMRCQNLEDRLFGLSKKGRHLETEHKAIVQLLRSHEHQIEAIHDDQNVKELLC